MNIRIVRWDAFTPLELIVINEALNVAFVDTEGGKWDNAAQEIAATIPECDEKAIVDELNKE